MLACACVCVCAHVCVHVCIHISVCLHVCWRERNVHMCVCYAGDTYQAANLRGQHPNPLEARFYLLIRSRNQMGP